MHTCPSGARRGISNRLNKASKLENAQLLQRGMTLIELLVVIAIIAMLAALLLPALSSTKANVAQTSCLNNLKEFEIAYQTYSADNIGKLVQNAPLSGQYENYSDNITNSWVYGNMKTLVDSTNFQRVQSGELFPYVPQTGSFHCPSDISSANGLPRVRSYSMNAWAGSSVMEVSEQGTGYRIFLRETDFTIPGPSQTWVFIDEHIMTLADGFFIVTMDNSDPFARFPATRHKNSYCLNFADGHAEAFRLRNPSNWIPETESLSFSQEDKPQVPATDADWIKLRNATTAR
jgi:prepilin-type N-terminal cleavage/methylation domain-containing protein